MTWPFLQQWLVMEICPTIRAAVSVPQHVATKNRTAARWLVNVTRAASVLKAPSCRMENVSERTSVSACSTARRKRQVRPMMIAWFDCMSCLVIEIRMTSQILWHTVAGYVAWFVRALCYDLQPETSYSGWRYLAERRHMQGLSVSRERRSCLCANSLYQVQENGSSLLQTFWWLNRV